MQYNMTFCMHNSHHYSISLIMFLGGSQLKKNYATIQLIRGWTYIILIN